MLGGLRRTRSGIVAIILGFVGRGRVKRGEANNGGMATAGIILGALAIIVSMAFVAWSGVFKDADVPQFFDCLSNAGQDHGARPISAPAISSSGWQTCSVSRHPPAESDLPPGST